MRSAAYLSNDIAHLYPGEGVFSSVSGQPTRHPPTPSTEQIASARLSRPSPSYFPMGKRSAVLHCMRDVGVTVQTGLKGGAVD